MGSLIGLAFLVVADAVDECPPTRTFRAKLDRFSLLGEKPEETYNIEGLGVFVANCSCSTPKVNAATHKSCVISVQVQFHLHKRP